MAFTRFLAAPTGSLHIGIKFVIISSELFSFRLFFAWFLRDGSVVGDGTIRPVEPHLNQRDTRR